MTKDHLLYNLQKQVSKSIANKTIRNKKPAISLTFLTSLTCIQQYQGAPKQYTNLTRGR